MTVPSAYLPRAISRTMAASSRHGIGAQNAASTLRNGCAAMSGTALGPNSWSRRRASSLVRPVEGGIFCAGDREVFGATICGRPFEAALAALVKEAIIQRLPFDSTSKPAARRNTPSHASRTRGPTIRPSKQWPIVPGSRYRILVGHHGSADPQQRGERGDEMGTAAPPNLPRNGFAGVSRACLNRIAPWPPVHQPNIPCDCSVGAARPHNPESAETRPCIPATA